MPAPYSIAEAAVEGGVGRKGIEVRWQRSRGEGMGAVVRGVKNGGALTRGLYRWVVGMKEKYEGRWVREKWIRRREFG
jgi:hypothetical protein